MTSATFNTVSPYPWTDLPSWFLWYHILLFSFSLFSTFFHDPFSLSRNCHSFHSRRWSPLYSDESHNYISIPDYVLTSRPKHPSKCLLNIYPQMALRDLWFNMSKMNLITFPLTLTLSPEFPVSMNDSTVHSVAWARKLNSILDTLSTPNTRPTNHRIMESNPALSLESSCISTCISAPLFQGNSHLEDSNSRLLCFHTAPLYSILHPTARMSF